MPRRSRSRSRSRSRRSRSNERRGGGGGGGGGSYSSNGRYETIRRSEMDYCRLHIADLTEDVTKSDLEKAFSKYGELEEIWMAKNPPLFAFVVFKNKDDANDALKQMDGRSVAGVRIRVTLALPRIPKRRQRWDSDTKCYQCGGRGHFSRDCYKNSRSRRHSRSTSRDRNRRSRSRSYGRNRSRSVSRSSPQREYKNGTREAEVRV